MPAQLTHIAYAQKYLERRPDLDRAAFLRGTTFPDIRRLADLERSVTHKDGAQMGAVGAEPDAWEAGRLLHSYLDMAWNLYFRDHGMRVGPEYPEKLWSAVKIAEESAYCGVLPGHEEVAVALAGEARALELAYGVVPETVTRWYAFVIFKLRTPFDLEVWRRHAVEIDFDPGKMDRLLERVEDVRRDPVWQERLVGLHTELGI